MMTDDFSFSFQNCPFYDYLQDNPLRLGNYRCDARKMLLVDCDLIINLNDTDYEEHKVLLLRAGINPDSFDNRLEICIAHRDILGKSFNRYVRKNYCLHRGHVDNTATKMDCKGTQITYPEALAALRCQNLKLPLNMPICKKCYDSVSEEIGTLPMETETASNVVSPESSESMTDPLSLETLNQVMDFIPLTRPVTRAHPMPQEPPVLQDQPTIQVEPFLPEPPALDVSETKAEQDRKQHKHRMEALNNFLEAWSLEKFPNRQHFKNVRFEDCKDPGRRRKVLKGVARACVAVFKTATEQAGDDCIAMWNQLKTSGLIEKELGFEPEMSQELQQHVLLYNRAPDYATQIQICAILHSIYKFCEVNRFNKHLEKSEGEEESDIDVSKLENNGKYWDPPLSYYIWKKAGAHAVNGALEKVVRQPVVRWKFNLECMQAIQAFVNHPSITQRVAYGTRWVVNPYGGKTEIAGVYRTIPNAELATQIAQHLVEQGVKEPHPKERTICAMLEKMPASKTKSLEARNKHTIFSTLAININILFFSTGHLPGD